MARDRDRDIPWRGFFLMGAIFATALVIFFVADIQRAIAGTHVVVAAFPEGGGIRPGAPVWVAGRESGKVTNVEMLPASEASTGGIVVEAEFPGSMRDILGTETRVRMAPGTPTSGEIVEFLPGGGSPLTPTDTVWGFSPVDRADLLISGLGRLARDMQLMFDTVQVVADAGELRVERLDALGAQAERVTDLLAETSDLIEASAGRRGDLLGDLNRLADGLGRLGGQLAEARARLRDAASAPGAADLRRTLPASIAELSEGLAALEAALSDPNGTLARLQADSAVFRAIGRARAQADSLFAELSENPGRMF